MINYLWARFARKAVAKALQDVRTTAKAFAFAVVEKKRLEAAYDLAVRETSSAKAKGEASVSAAKAGRATRRKVVRLTAEAKAEVARAKAAEASAFSADNALDPQRIEWAHNRAVLALQKARTRSEWATILCGPR